MKAASRPSVRAGARLNEFLTVLGVLDRHHGDIVCIVWNHRAWCPMACKVFATPAAAARETGILTALNHPNIVRYFGTVEPSLVLMEFLEGPTLEDLVNDEHAKRFSISNALRVVIHVGAALQHLHAQGFVHLDVAPTNIIIAPGGKPVLFDFGTTRRQDKPRPPEVIGTDPFMSPEECALGKVTPASDVFSLAVTLYEMLCHRFPFPEGTRRERFPQLTQAPTPLRQYRREAPAALERLLLDCLSREPATRPSLDELLPALNAFITSGPPILPEGLVETPPPSHKRATRRPAEN